MEKKNLIDLSDFIDAAQSLPTLYYLYSRNTNIVQRFSSWVRVAEEWYGNAIYMRTGQVLKEKKKFIADSEMIAYCWLALLSTFELLLLWILRRCMGVPEGGSMFVYLLCESGACV